MIQIINGLPDNVVAFVATGRVTTSECDAILIPAVANARQRHDRLRLYYELECRFPGAAWEDLDIASLQLQPWERVALVTDVSWVRHTVKALRFLIPAEIRVYTTARADEGRAWIAEGLRKRRASAASSEAAHRQQSRSSPWSASLESSNELMQRLGPSTLGQQDWPKSWPEEG